MQTVADTDLATMYMLERFVRENRGTNVIITHDEYHLGFPEWEVEISYKHHSIYVAGSDVRKDQSKGHVPLPQVVALALARIKTVMNA